MATTAPRWALWLLDPHDRPLAQLDDAVSWDYERRVNQVGTARLTLSRASANLLDAWPLATRLSVRLGTLDADGFWTWREDWGGLILGRRYQQPDDGRPAARYTFTAYDWLHLLRGRVVQPPAGLEFLDLDGSYADVSMKAAVRASLTAPTDPGRLYSTITVQCQADANQGGAVKYSARYERLYDVVASLAGQGGIAFDVVRTAPAPANTVEFRTYSPRRGLDRTAANGVNAPAIFTLDLGTVSDLDYSEDASSLENAVLALGAGDGAARVVTEVRDGTSVGLYDRWEGATDVRTATTTADAAAQAQPYLQAHALPEVSLSFTVPQTSPLVYGRDWDLGDRVTVQIPELGVTLEAEITVVRVQAADNVARPQVTPTIGMTRRTLLDRVADLTRGLQLRAHV